MNSNDIISSGLLELYALSLTSAEESEQVRKWLIEFPDVKAELMAIEKAMESYAHANSIPPPIGTKESILAKISTVHNPLSSVHRNEEIVNVYKIPTWYKWAAAACLFLLAGSLILNYNFYDKYRRANADLQVAHNQVNEQKQVADAMNKDMTVMTDKYALPVVLNGTPHAPDALAKIYWMKNTGEVYIDPTNLPEVPSGKQYQLWAIVDGKPVDAGMISTKKGVYHIQKMKTFGKAEAFAITMEKEGGSPTPTMEEMYVIAKI